MGEHEIRGFLYKDGKHWLIELPELDIMTQGHTRNDAFSMLNDYIRTDFDDYTQFNIDVQLDKDVFLVFWAVFPSDSPYLKHRKKQLEGRF